MASPSYIEILDRFPPELRQPLAQLVDALKDEWGIKRVDFEELKGIVRELAQAQQRTEVRLEELAQAQKELVQAQKRTEERLDQLNRNFEAKIGGLGARWGLQSESAFREGRPTTGPWRWLRGSG